MKPILAAGLCCAALAAEPPEAIRFSGRLGPVAALPGGRLISLYTSGRSLKETGLEGPEQPVFLRYSSDHGRNWSQPQLVFSYPPGKGSMSRQIYTLIDRQGRIHAFGTRYFRLMHPPDPSSGSSEIMHNLSSDGGHTWSPPGKVDFGHAYTGAINSIIQLSRGRILAAFSYASDNFIEKAGQREFRGVTTYSDDGGGGWRVGMDNIRVPLGPQLVHPGAIEPVLVELKDGRVWMLIRTQTLRFYESFSRDGGESWTAPKASRFMAPDSPASVTRLSDGRLLLCWNDISEYPGGITGHYRQYLYAAVSSDDGKTWSRSRLVAPLADADSPQSKADYPFLCETAEKKVLLLYTRFGVRTDATYENQHNEVVLIDPNWIRPK